VETRIETSSALAAGTLLGGEFTVVRQLGIGGMGAVYVAQQKSTEKLRALKVMHRDIAPDAAMQRRFEQEARIGAQIKSGHIVEVVAAGVDAATGLPYLVMELLEGVDLRAHMRERGAMLLFEVHAIFEQLCHGIAAAHAVGIVHRDLKPENVFLARTNQAGAASLVKVLDFGIAKLASEVGTHGTAAIGSPLWMAPEQTEPGPVTAAADVWALGLIAYEMLVGAHFWRAATVPTATPMHLLREIVLEPIPLASERGGAKIPPGFDAWFARCVARDPAARFPDAGEAWRALRPLSTPGLRISASGRPISFGVEALAATSAADTPALRAAMTDAPGSATPASDAPVLPQAPSSPPPRAPVATPLATLMSSSGAPLMAPLSAPSSSPWPKVSVGLGLAVALLVGMRISEYRAPPSSPPTPLPQVPVSPAVARPSPALPEVPSIPPLGEVPPVPPVPPVPVARPLPPVPSHAPLAPAPSVAATPPIVPTSRDGFADPADGAREGTGKLPSLWKVQGHHVRLFTRIVSNGSNVIDSVVRGAIDWSAWEYSRCYESTFGAARELPEGTITLSFDILDQLPRHAAKEASTFTSAAMDECIVRTVSAHTMNAARSAGAGHIVYAFKFIVAD